MSIGCYYNITVISKSLKPVIQISDICKFYDCERIIQFYVTQYPTEVASDICPSTIHGLFSLRTCPIKILCFADL